ncbi:Tripartite-type tricarboxylate transporter, receptor component TctC [Roseomonas rosea]|uniref:Tripartite-type tricarboxylate transporter, receptor component TctC n=1 Tax=Muricoccus roseus TaxID=198092 RepID=A0A1M6R4B8_9PROT|nr:Tripartite-type tricarboxylate transporter, receptor component TctC [Roseomonas rosea]
MERRALVGLASAAILSSASVVKAQPQRPPLRIVVPYGPGGSTDAIARVLAASLAPKLRRTVIVENRGGAGGLIGVRFVQSAPPDGNVLLFTPPGYITLTMVNRAAGYDPVKDFEPVALVGSSPLFLMVHKDIPATTVQEFIAFAKSQPDGINVANAGMGSVGHIAAMLFEHQTGVKLTHVAYRGTAEAGLALISGVVKMQINSTTLATNEAMRNGTIRFLAVIAESRSSLAPEVPVIGDVFRGAGAEPWYGFLGPPGLPAGFVQEMDVALRAALEESEVQGSFAAGAIQTTFRPAAEMQAVVRSSTEFWRRAFRELNIAPQ